MSTPRRTATLALVAWTFLVWTTRLNNIVADESLDGAAKVGRLALALSFTALAAAVVWTLTRRRARLSQAVTALAVWTVVVWAVRSVGIALADHDAGFIAVHLALAAVSTVLAALAVRELRQAPQRELSPRQ